jgi:nitrogen fixation protein FixH
MTRFIPRMPLVPALFVAGLAIVVAVNGTMMWFAISSFSGLYSDHARDRGVHYNNIVAEQRARDALGWRVVPVWKDGRIQVTLLQKTGAPLEGAHLVAELVRPTEKRAPVPVVWSDKGNGQFSGEVTLPERGNWDIDIVVDAQGHRFAETRRMFLQ